jgi:hypothetical protein
MYKDNLDKFGSAGKINTVLPNEVKIEFLPRHYCSQRTPGKVGLNFEYFISFTPNWNEIPQGNCAPWVALLKARSPVMSPASPLVMFVMALSEYDQRLYEDETVNRMHESLDLFSQMLTSPFFATTSFIIFFNKQAMNHQWPYRDSITRFIISRCLHDIPLLRTRGPHS